MTRHIGIVATSGDGPVLCYQTICEEGSELLGRYRHPVVTMQTIPLADYLRHANAGQWQEVGELLLSSAEALARAGAELLVCPVNTLHNGIDLVRERAPLPWLHIAEEVANVAVERGYRRLLVLGTRFLMDGPVYASKLGERGIENEVPDDSERDRLDRAILDELVVGRFEDATRDFVAGVIDDGRKRGCDAAVLACTELPLLIDDAHSPLPTLDTTRILARATLREAVRE